MAEKLTNAVEAMERGMTHRTVKDLRRRLATRLWRNNPGGQVRGDATGEEALGLLKHGVNLLIAEYSEFPIYHHVRPEHVDRGHEWMRERSLRDIWDLHCMVPLMPTAWQLVAEPLERLTDKIERVFAVAEHVRNVIDPTAKYLVAYRFASLMRYTLYRRLRRCDRFQRSFLRLLGGRGDIETDAQRRATAYLMILFEQDGINLQHNGIWRDDPIAWDAVQLASKALFNISTRWESNIESDKASKTILIRVSEQVAGLPSWVLKDASEEAIRGGYPKSTPEDGPWMITLEDAIADSVLRYGKDRWLREWVWTNRERVAFLGGVGTHDNTPLLNDMLQIRLRYANLLNYNSHTEMVFAKLMATPKQAYGFLGRIRKEGVPLARLHLLELQEFAKQQGAPYELSHHDVEFWREQLLEQKLGLRPDYLRQHLPLDSVLKGLFGLLRRLFGVDIVEEKEDVKVWAKGVRLFRVREADTAQLLGSFFLDAHRRRTVKKRGFWVSKIQGYSTLMGDRNGPRRPAVHVVCDFEEYREDGPPQLLAMEEVTKLFHVMGGAVRHLLCEEPEGLPELIGAQELDSLAMMNHFLERWAYEKETLRSMTKHVETGDPLPEAALDAVGSARTFQSVFKLLKRAANAQVDLDLHSQYDPYEGLLVTDMETLVHAEYSVIPQRVQDHPIMSQPIHEEYGSCLYAKIWAEALAADCFARFERVGLDNDAAVQSLGRKFRETILKPGAGRAPVVALEEFLGRPPALASFLKHAGIQGAAAAARDPATPVPGSYESYKEVFEDDSDYVAYEETEVTEESAVQEEEARRPREQEPSSKASTPSPFEDDEDDGVYRPPS